MNWTDYAGIAVVGVFVVLPLIVACLIVHHECKRRKDDKKRKKFYDDIHGDWWNEF